MGMAKAPAARWRWRGVWRRPGPQCRAKRSPRQSAEHRAGLVALSALLTVTMPAMKTTVEAFQAAGLRPAVKIMIGGAPVTQRYADAIGADEYGESAGSAVALARRLVAGALQGERL